MADTIDWNFESNEIDPKMTFARPMDNDDTMSLMGQEDMDVLSDAESAIRNLPMTETYMTMMTGDAMTNPRWNMRILRKAVRMKVSMILVQLLEGKLDV